MQLNKVLVVTATIGNRVTLLKTLESVKNIGGDNVKHVVVCPIERINYIKDKYGDVECIADTGVKGIYPALNHGLNFYGKQYKFMTFLNDDDYWLPNYRKLIEKALSNDYDIVYGKVMNIDFNGETVNIRPSSNRFKDFLPLFRHNVSLMTQQSAIFKSELFFKLRGFDENYKIIADAKFWIQSSLLKKLKWNYVDEVCAAYMYQDGQISSNQDVLLKEHVELMKEFASFKGNGYKELLLFRMMNIFFYIKRYYMIIIQKYKMSSC